MVLQKKNLGRKFSAENYETSEDKRLKAIFLGYMYVEFSLALETLSSKFLAAKKAIKIIPMGVDDKAQPYLA